MARTPAYSLNVGSLLGKSFGIYFKNLLPFVLLAALIFAPWIVLEIMLERSPSRELLIGSTVVNSALNPILAGAVTFGVIQRLRGQQVSLGETITVGLQSFLRVFLTALVTGLLTGLCFLLLVVPGIIVSILWYVAIPAAVMEGKNVSEAMSRSTRLTEGSRWQIFASWLVVGVITAVVGFVVVMVLMATAPHLVDDTTHRLPAWANIAIGLLLAPLGAVMSATCYFLLRTGKEHADADQIAAVFD